MSLAAIRSALETALDGMSPSLATAWENRPFTPVVGTPFQQVTLLPAEPENIEIGSVNYTERGIFWINLFYPKDKGAKDAMARAALIRSTFAYGNTFTSGSTKVVIIGTPEIGPARIDGDRYMLPVRVRWNARVTA